MYHRLMAALNFLTEEIILDNYFVDIYKFNMDITEADIHLQTEETAGFRFATADEIKVIADRGEFLHYDSIRKVFE